MNSVYGDRSTSLGEGLLWHPERGQIPWFDILAVEVLSRHDKKAFEWRFDDTGLAAGWIDRDRLNRALLPQGCICG